MLDTSGKETHPRYLHVCSKQLCLCRVGSPVDGLLGKFHTCRQWCQVIYRKDPERWSAPFSGYNCDRFQTTAETPELHNPECCSMPHGSPLASAAGGSALLDWGLHLTCCPPAPEILPCKMLTTPLPTVRSPGPTDWDSGTQVRYPPVGCSVCVIFLLDCQSVCRILCMLMFYFEWTCIQ